MRKYEQDTLLNGEKLFLETKGKVLSTSVYEKGIYPIAKCFEIGGYRIILPNGDTTFLFYSDVERTFAE